MANIVSYKVTLHCRLSEKLVFNCDDAENMEMTVLMLKNAQYIDSYDGKDKEKEITIEPVFNSTELVAEDNG